MKTTKYDRDNLKAWAFNKVKYGGDWPEIAKTISNLIDDLEELNHDLAGKMGEFVQQIESMENKIKGVIEMKSTKEKRESAMRGFDKIVEPGPIKDSIASLLRSWSDEMTASEIRIADLEKINSDVAHMVGRLVERVSLLETTLERSAKSFDKLGLALMKDEAAYSAASHAAQVCREALMRSRAMEK